RSLGTLEDHDGQAIRQGFDRGSLFKRREVLRGGDDGKKKEQYERANCRVFHRTSTASGHGLMDSIPGLGGPETGKKFHSTWEERRMSNGWQSPVASLQSPGNAVVGRRSSVVGSNIKHLISRGRGGGHRIKVVAILSG